MDVVQNIKATIALALSGTVVFVGAFVLIDRITPYDLWKELCENRNQPIATLAAAICLGISIIIAAAIHS